MNETRLDLTGLPQLSVLFKELSNGKHINRLSDPELWLALENDQQAYQNLFAALGYTLRIDGRGFAWFQHEEVSSSVSKTSRQLALLFMVIFDTQADAGQALLRFSEWQIDRALLVKAWEQHQELLYAENLDVEGLFSLLETASRFGFTRLQTGHWQLLPAVCRYLDHIEALAAQTRDAEPLDEVMLGEPLAHDDERDDAL